MLLKDESKQMNLVTHIEGYTPELLTSKKMLDEPGVLCKFSCVLLPDYCVADLEKRFKSKIVSNRDGNE